MEQAIGAVVFVGMAWLAWRAFRRVPPIEPVEVGLRVIDAGTTRLLDVRDNPPEVLADPRALEALAAQAASAGGSLGGPARGLVVWVFPDDALCRWPTTDRGAAALASVLFATGHSGLQGLAVPDGAPPAAVLRAMKALRVEHVQDLSIIAADGRTLRLAELLAA